jgi:hypothetical protein
LRGSQARSAASDHVVLPRSGTATRCQALAWAPSAGGGRRDRLAGGVDRARVAAPSAGRDRRGAGVRHCNAVCMAAAATRAALEPPLSLHDLGLGLSTGQASCGRRCDVADAHRLTAAARRFDAADRFNGSRPGGSRSSGRGHLDAMPRRECQGALAAGTGAPRSSGRSSSAQGRSGA